MNLQAVMELVISSLESINYVKKMSANEILFRASSNGYLMTEPKLKSEKLSEGTKTHLIDIFISYYYKRREEINSKFLDKGNNREEDSLTLLSLTDPLKRIYNKNEERLSNEYITCVPDAFIGESIYKAKETFDTKTSWSLHTFMRAKHKKIDPMYYWQGVTQMWATGAEKHTTAYCLVNGTAQAIADEKRRLSFKHGMIDGQGNESDEFIRQCKQIEINHIFDLQSFISENEWFEFHNDVNSWEFDIPKKDRIFRFEIERNEADIERLKSRILDCREWMNENLFKTK